MSASVAPFGEDLWISENRRFRPATGIRKIHRSSPKGATLADIVALANLYRVAKATMSASVAPFGEDLWISENRRFRPATGIRKFSVNASVTLSFAAFSRRTSRIVISA